MEVFARKQILPYFPPKLFQASWLKISQILEKQMVGFFLVPIPEEKNQIGCTKLPLKKPICHQKGHFLEINFNFFWFNWNPEVQNFETQPCPCLVSRINFTLVCKSNFPTFKSVEYRASEWQLLRDPISQISKLPTIQLRLVFTKSMLCHFQIVTSPHLQN